MAQRRPSRPEDPEFHEMRRRFVRDASGMARMLRAALDAGGGAAPAGDAGLVFRKVAHDLRAAGGSYGFPIVSLYAGEVEDSYVDRAKPDALSALVKMLEDSLEQASEIVG